MDNGDIEGGGGDEELHQQQQQGRRKYSPVVAHDRAVLEMSTIDPGSSSSSRDPTLRYCLIS